MKKLWDISPFIDEASPVFPGDTTYSQRLHFTLDKDCPVNVHALTLSPHVGAHGDAPLHYAAGAPAIGLVDLAPYLGACRVIHCHDKANIGASPGLGPLVQPEQVRHALQNLPPRVLLRTSASASQRWTQFTAIAPETLSLLRAHSTTPMLLIGIDTPSIDPADSSLLPCHHLLLAHELRVLENLVLDDVPEGDYELIALPLKLRHSDASPVRAVLRSLT
jgi:arylformamidase